MDYYDEVVEAVFDQHWRDIVMPDGEWDLEQVKKELYDYRQLMLDASEVYCHVTMNKISKLNTRASSVIGVADEVLQDLIHEAVQDDREEAIEEIKRSYGILDEIDDSP